MSSYEKFVVGGKIMTKKWVGMNFIGKLSYIMAGILLLALPTAIVSGQLFNTSFVSPEHFYLFYIGVGALAALTKQWKLFFGVMAGSLFLSSTAIVASEMIGMFF